MGGALQTTSWLTVGGALTGTSISGTQGYFTSVTAAHPLTVSGDSDSGDNSSALSIIDTDDTAGSKLPAIMFYGGSTLQARIRGGDGTFAIAVGSTPTTVIDINNATSATTFSGTVKGDGDATQSLGATDKRWGTSYITKLAASDGNESNPSHTFQNDLNTGMWRPNTDIIAFSTAGSERLRIDASGDVSIGGNLAVAGTIDCDTLDGLDSSQVLQSGQDGAYYTFNGTNEYVEIPDLRPVVSADATMAAWVTADDINAQNNFGHHRSKRFYIWIEPDSGVGYFGVGVADQNNIGAGAGKTSIANHGIANGDWFHVAVVADGGTARAYINGVQDSTFSYTQSTSTDPDANILIGKVQDATAYSWTGKTRDVKIYPSALSATEIKKLYSGENPKRNVDMVTAPDFNTTYWTEGTGWTVGPSGATHTGSAGYITQTPRENYVNGAQYVATCDVIDVYDQAAKPLSCWLIMPLPARWMCSLRFLAARLTQYGHRAALI